MFVAIHVLAPMHLGVNLLQAMEQRLSAHRYCQQSRVAEARQASWRAATIFLRIGLWEQAAHDFVRCDSHKCTLAMQASQHLIQCTVSSGCLLLFLHFECTMASGCSLLFLPFLVRHGGGGGGHKYRLVQFHLYVI